MRNNPLLAISPVANTYLSSLGILGRNIKVTIFEKKKKVAVAGGGGIRFSKTHLVFLLNLDAVI